MPQKAFRRRAFDEIRPVQKQHLEVYVAVQGTAKALAALRRFKDRRGKEYAITDIGLFGSVARDEAVAAPEVDIVYKRDRPNLFRSSRMRQELAELLGCGMDVVRCRDRMNPSLKVRIEREALYV
jgi:uncharacterized protein